MVIAIALLSVSLISILLLVPQGSHVYVLADVDNELVSIEQCALKKNYLISLVRPEDNISQGDRNLVLRIFYNQTEILTSNRCTRYNIGTGTCVLESNMLPTNLPIDAELLIRVELYDANDLFIASTEDNLVYK